jgi:sulfopyruvate decarboxylase alpha subunit
MLLFKKARVDMQYREGTSLKFLILQTDRTLYLRKHLRIINDGRWAAVAWQEEVFEALKAANLKQVSYVPDAGHATLISLLADDHAIRSVPLTTEEEGVAMAAGAWLGGERAALLMQSSGVGNCVNMFSLMSACRIPLLALVTMRGEFGEMNPWQMPMGAATPAVLEAMGVRTLRVTQASEAAETVAAATVMAFDAEQAIAVLFSQKLLGAKRWRK